MFHPSRPASARKGARIRGKGFVLLLRMCLRPFRLHGQQSSQNVKNYDDLNGQIDDVRFLLSTQL